MYFVTYYFSIFNKLKLKILLVGRSMVLNKKFNKLNYIKMTGIVYDERMCLHKMTNHCEQPERIRSIFKTIENSGHLAKCKLVPIRVATDDEILSVHTQEYLNTIKMIPIHKEISLLRLEAIYDSVYLNKHSYDAAILSAGGVVELCDQVVSGHVTNGIAIVRPPGHHAECNKAMGFCLLNNVAIAAKTMINKHSLQRVAILDWDVHHGNSTQHMFENNNDVLYISIHRYENGGFYPYGPDGDSNNIGSGIGIGKNVNIAWNTNTNPDKIGDTEYIYAFNTLIKPMLEEYDPELIIVSAGFDCALGDQLGGLRVTPAAFNYMTSQLMNFANGGVVLALEGGYNLESISMSMLACLRALLGEDLMPICLNNNISSIAINAINETSKAHRLHWNFLKNCT